MSATPISTSCGNCYKAANIAVRVAQKTTTGDAIGDHTTMAMACHIHALHIMHGVNNNTSDETTKLRHTAVADMMLNRVCPMLPSAMELGKEKSKRTHDHGLLPHPALQRAHATRDICSSQC